MSLSHEYLLPLIYDGLASPTISPSSSQIGAAGHMRSPFRTAPLRALDRSTRRSRHTVTAPISNDVIAPTTVTPALTPGPAVRALTSPVKFNSNNGDNDANDHALNRDDHPAFKPHNGAATEPAIPPNSLLPTQLRGNLATIAKHRRVSDSLTRERKGKMPALSHLLSVGGGGRVLSLEADERYVFAGCQSRDNEIVVFSRATLQPLFRLLGHQGSILALLVIPEKGWLVSSSSAGDVRIWSTTTLQPVHIIHPCDDTSGSIYSLAWDDRNGGTLYFGSQSASIEWVHFGRPTLPRTRKPSLPSTIASITVPVKSASKPTTPNQRTGRYRPHSFFDNPPSAPSSGANTPTCATCSPAAGSSKYLGDSFESRTRTPPPPPENPASSSSSTVSDLEVDQDCRIAFAHYGYIYALAFVSRPNKSCWLVSGSGDSEIKIWETSPSGGLRLIQTFSDLPGAVLSLALRESLLFAGLQDGDIKVWDLETGACIRSIQAHESDVLAMATLRSDVYTAAGDGRVMRFNDEFDCTASFRAHQGVVLSSTIVQATHSYPGGEDDKGVRWELITAGDDSYVKIWTIDPPGGTHDTSVDVEGEGDVMLYALSKLVAIPTVSDEEHRESCRQGAHLLRRILAQLGAQAELLSSEPGKNPLVLATFSGQETGKPRKRVLFYGHYDVQPADEQHWETNPWELSGRNGYLYGRGVSDNKGPILAVACAAAALRQRRELDVDVVLLIEGEEEAGSRGFAKGVRAHKDLIGHVDLVLLSNSTWIDETDPCVVFGMRGVLHATIEIGNDSHHDDAHSGVDGGVVAEPMFDLVRVLAGIAGAQGVKLPGFYDQVREQTPDEMALLSAVANASGRPVEDLIKVWRQPSFSIANISSSGSSNKTIIPRKVRADISLRIVPDQDLDTIAQTLITHTRSLFDLLASSNTFTINVTHQASWWLTSLDSPYFKALEESVKDVWGVEPLKIREGGTVPTIFWLEREFGAACVHLPLGQASDAGHLANERMRLLNLRNGKRVIENYLVRLSSL